MRLPQLRAVVIGHLIDVFWDVFVANYGQIMAGERSNDLKASLSKEDASWFQDMAMAHLQTFVG